MKGRKTITDVEAVKKGYYERLQKLIGHDLKQLFAKKFKEQKEKAGFSNSQLSDILNVSRSTIDKWLGGSSMPRNIEELLKVCALFDKPLRYFTGELDLTVSEIAESSGLTGLEPDTLKNLIDLAAFLDTFAGHKFNDYYYVVNKLFGSRSLLRAVFEYICVSNAGITPAKFGGVDVDCDFLKRVELERIKKALDEIASGDSVYSELAVIDVTSLYDPDEEHAVMHLPFPFD